MKIAGIKILSMRESAGMPGVPWLFITVLGGITKLKGFAFYVKLQIGQNVFLERNRRAAFAFTWDTGSYGLNPNKEGIQLTIKKETDVFINAYLSVNPKK